MGKSSHGSETHWQKWLYKIWSTKNGEFYIVDTHKTDEENEEYKKKVCNKIRELYEKKASVVEVVKTLNDMEERLYLDTFV